MSARPRILPPIWLLLALIAMGLLHRYWPLHTLVDGRARWVGTAPLAAGFMVTGLSAWRFHRVGTGLIPFDEARTLVTDGFFRWSRNPMYLGMLLILVGAAVLYGTAGALLPIPIFVLIIRQRFILPEEQFMENAFGQQYRDYRARVRRWL